jgi:hypothetical protein
MEGGSYDLIDVRVLSHHLPGGTEENQNFPQYMRTEVLIEVARKLSVF